MKANKKNSYEKMMKLTEEYKAMIASSITSITDQINSLKYLPTQNDSPKPPDLTTVVLSIRRDTQLEGG